MSNQMVGMGTGSLFLLISILLRSGDSQFFMHLLDSMEIQKLTSVFFMYFVAGMAGIVLFAYIDETFRVGLPMFISLSIFLVCIAANYVLPGNEMPSFETGFIILANLLICILLLLIFLRYYSTAVVHGYRDKYMEINDPECPVLVELKQKSKVEYYRAIHTAYVSEKIAKQLELDAAAAKTCGYYHKIGILKGANSWNTIYEICQEYRFPPAAIALLKEYTDKETYLISKEAVAVLFADTLVTSILYLFSKDPKVQPDYNQIIEAIYEKKLDSGILDKSKITLGELNEMKRLLMEEKLYYDFLR